MIILHCKTIRKHISQHVIANCKENLAKSGKPLRKIIGGRVIVNCKETPTKVGKHTISSTEEGCKQGGVRRERESAEGSEYRE